MGCKRSGVRISPARPLKRISRWRKGSYTPESGRVIGVGSGPSFWRRWFLTRRGIPRSRVPISSTSTRWSMPWSSGCWGRWLPAPSRVPAGGGASSSRRFMAPGTSGTKASRRGARLISWTGSRIPRARRWPSRCMRSGRLGGQAWRRKFGRECSDGLIYRPGPLQIAPHHDTRRGRKTHRRAARPSSSA